MPPRRRVALGQRLARSQAPAGAVEPPRPDWYSEWFALRCIYCWYVLNWEPAEIAAHWWLSLSTVFRMIRRFKAGARLVGATGRRGNSYRTRKLQPSHISYLLLLLNTRSDLFLDEFAGELKKRFNVSVSLSVVFRALREKGITRKQMHKRAAEASADARRQFELVAKYLPADRLWFMDESAVDKKTHLRQYGYARRGQRTRNRQPFLRGQRYSVLPLAHGTHGVVDALICKGSVNSAVLAQFTAQILLPRLLPGDVLILDNASIHRTEAFKAAVRSTGARLLYLPPYTPELNPIEKVFSKMKAYLRRNQGAAQLLEPEEMIIRALSTVTSRDMNNWLRTDWKTFWLRADG